MGFRVQPRGIMISKSEPFEEDTLNRKEHAEVLTTLALNIEGPCVLAVDARWGMGKTTFLRMWAQHLRNEKLAVVEFNAWETDFADDPFLALSEELHEELQKHKGLDGERVEAVKKAARDVFMTGGRVLLKNTISAMLSPVAGEAIDAVFERILDDRTSQYGCAKKAIGDFREALEKAAVALSERGDAGAGPLVVLIDELDRCRPSYALELLEVAKHLFSVDRVVFVLALNRDQLVHSVGALYGTDFDAMGYLRRFIDIDVRLPDSDRKAFIDNCLTGIRKRQENANTQRDDPRKVQGTAADWLHKFFGANEVDLRTVEQALHRLGLMLATLPPGYDAIIGVSALALILRTIDPGLYRRFVSGDASDKDVAEALFSRTGEDYRNSNDGMFLEVEIIVAGNEEELLKMRIESVPSALLREYYPVAERFRTSRDALARPTSEKEKRALWIVGEIDRAIGKRSHHGGGLWFRQSVERLELFSEDLLGGQRF